MIRKNMYLTEPTDKKQFTQKFDQAYGRMAKVCDVIVKLFPLWRNWISQAVPHKISRRKI
jgi:hypothetical protein